MRDRPFTCMLARTIVNMVKYPEPVVRWRILHLLNMLGIDSLASSWSGILRWSTIWNLDWAVSERRQDRLWVILRLLNWNSLGGICTRFAAMVMILSIGDWVAVNRREGIAVSYHHALVVRQNLMVMVVDAVLASFLQGADVLDTWVVHWIGGAERLSIYLLAGTLVLAGVVPLLLVGTKQIRSLARLSGIVAWFVVWEIRGIRLSDSSNIVVVSLSSNSDHVRATSLNDPNIPRSSQWSIWCVRRPLVAYLFGSRARSWTHSRSVDRVDRLVLGSLFLTSNSVMVVSVLPRASWLTLLDRSWPSASLNIRVVDSTTWVLANPAVLANLVLIVVIAAHIISVYALRWGWYPRGRHSVWNRSLLWFLHQVVVTRGEASAI